MTNRCTHCGTGDHCDCALNHRNDKTLTQLRRDLEQIPDLYAHLTAFLVRGRTDDGVFGSPSGSRPPMDLAVIDLLDEREKRDAPPTRLGDAKYGGGADHDHLAGTRRQGVLPTLSSWVRDVDSARWDEGDEHQNPPTQRTVHGECGWLIESLDWITEQPWVTDMARDIRQIRNDLRTAIRDRDVTENLTCIRPGCGWDVKPQAGGSWFKCTGCGESWGRLELHKMADRKRPRPLKECAELTGNPHRTLRYLVAEGILRHVARDGNRNLYDIQDVVVAAAKVKIRLAASSS